MFIFFIFLFSLHLEIFFICSISTCYVAETLEPEVKIVELSILSPGRPDIVLPIPEDGNPKGLWFTLKEGSRYNLKFTFNVSNNIVSGLKYTNTVWKTAIKGNKLILHPIFFFITIHTHICVCISKTLSYFLY